MKTHIKKLLSILLVVMLMTTILTACASSEPCERCGNTPTKGYKNDYTGEKEYYCERCSSDCTFCSNKATKHYTSAMGLMVFVCDDCYDYIQDLNS